MKQITKREAWNEIKKDKFLKLLAEKFGCAGFKNKKGEWKK